MNIGLVGRVYPPRRRWFTTDFFDPQADPRKPDAITPVPLSLWNSFDDTFEHADQLILDNLANWIGMNCTDFNAALQRRSTSLQQLAAENGGRGVDPQEMFDAISALRDHEKKSTP